ncbi:MAG TPA: hypothetical protein DIT65_04310, partial [Cryomorphaceae bacterium]|nr:hypothetical protein [Cryomorphaceae bacterium]
MNTAEQFDAVLSKCHGLFEKKGKDYGTAWRILRLPSLTDQIFIKAQRLRSIELKGEQLVDDPLEGEFIGILNYSIMALIQLDKGIAEQPDMNWAEASAAYIDKANEAKKLMLKKNHDYGEAWR